MPDTRRDDPYRLLGIDPAASAEQIRGAFRRRVRELHPDLPGGDAQLLAAVVAAYELLSDPRRRAEHDRRPARPQADGTPVPVRVHSTAPRPSRGPDLRAGPVHYHPWPR
jgi:curved DNA-binding protein CbpA